MKIVYNQEFLSLISKPGSKVSIKDYQLSSYETPVRDFRRLYSEDYMESIKLSPSDGKYSFDSIWDEMDKKLYINLEIPDLDIDILKPDKYKVIYVYYTDQNNRTEANNDSNVAFLLIGDYDTNSDGDRLINPLRLSLGRNLIVIDLSSENVVSEIDTQMNEDTNFLEGKGPDTGVNIYYALEKIEKMEDGPEKDLYLQSLISIGSWEKYIRDLQNDDTNIDQSVNPYLDKNGIKVFNSYIYYEYTNFQLYFNEISDKEESKKLILAGDAEGNLGIHCSVHVSIHIRKNGRDLIIQEYDDTNIAKEKLLFSFEGFDSDSNSIPVWCNFEEQQRILEYTKNPDALLQRILKIKAKFITNPKSQTTIDSDEIVLIQEEGPLYFNIIEDNGYFYYNDDPTSTELGQKRLKILEGIEGDYVTFQFRCNGLISFITPSELLLGTHAFDEFFTVEKIETEDKYLHRFRLITKSFWTRAPWLAATNGQPTEGRKHLGQEYIIVEGTSERVRPFKIIFNAAGKGKLNENQKRFSETVYSLQKSAHARFEIRHFGTDAKSPIVPEGGTDLSSYNPGIGWISQSITVSGWKVTQYKYLLDRPIAPFVPDDDRVQYFETGLIIPYKILNDSTHKKLVNTATARRQIGFEYENREVRVTITLCDDEDGVEDYSKICGNSYEDDDFKLDLYYGTNSSSWQNMTEQAKDPTSWGTSYDQEWTKPYPVGETPPAPYNIQRAGITMDGRIYYKCYLPSATIDFVRNGWWNTYVNGRFHLTSKKNNYSRTKYINNKRICVSWYPKNAWQGPHSDPDTARDKFDVGIEETETMIKNWDRHWEKELEIPRAKIPATQDKAKKYIVTEETEEIVLKDFNAVPFNIRSNCNVFFYELPAGASSLDNPDKDLDDSTFQALIKERGFVSFHGDPNNGLAQIAHYILPTSADPINGSTIYVRLKNVKTDILKLNQTNKVEIGTLQIIIPDNTAIPDGSDDDRFKVSKKYIKVFFDDSSIPILKPYPNLVFNNKYTNTGLNFLSWEMEKESPVNIYTNKPLLIDNITNADDSFGEILTDPNNSGRKVQSPNENQKNTLVPFQYDGKTLYSVNLEHHYSDEVLETDFKGGTQYQYSSYYIEPNINNTTTEVFPLLKMLPRINSKQTGTTNLPVTIFQLGFPPFVDSSASGLEENKVTLGYGKGNSSTFTIKCSYPESVSYILTNPNKCSCEITVDPVVSGAVSVTVSASEENESGLIQSLGQLHLIANAPEWTNPYSIYEKIDLTDVYFDGVETQKITFDISQLSKEFTIQLIEIDKEGNALDQTLRNRTFSCQGEERYYRVDANFNWIAESIYHAAGESVVFMTGQLYDVIWRVPNKLWEFPSDEVYNLLDIVNNGSNLRYRLKPILSTNSVGIKVYKTDNSGYNDRISTQQLGFTRYIYYEIRGSSIPPNTGNILIGKYNRKQISVSGVGENIILSSFCADLAALLNEGKFGDMRPIEYRVEQIGDYILPEEYYNQTDQYNLNMNIPIFLSDTPKTRSIGVTIFQPNLPNGEVQEFPIEFIQESCYFRVVGQRKLYFFANGMLAKKNSQGNWDEVTSYLLPDTTIQTNLQMMTEVDTGWGSGQTSTDDIEVSYLNVQTNKENIISKAENGVLFWNIEFRQIRDDEYSIIIGLGGHYGKEPGNRMNPQEGYLRFRSKSTGVLLDEIHILQGSRAEVVYDSWYHQGSFIKGDYKVSPSILVSNSYGSENPIVINPYYTGFVYRFSLRAWENPDANSWEEIQETLTSWGDLQLNYGANPSGLIRNGVFSIQNQDRREILVELWCEEATESYVLYTDFSFRTINPITGRVYSDSTWGTMSTRRIFMTLKKYRR